jgi:MFS transporter, MHS family, proline/betaine transporter
MGFFSSLTKSQKETAVLLQVGTFLEYFDLMLYVHMAVLLNELFFPKTDPYTASLLSAFAFCSTFVLRPFGALIFGYIGDHIGRKHTVMMTTMMMAVSCIVMASVPTYAQIGIAAAWCVTACRVIQGISSLGEVVAAEVYLTEKIPHPFRHPVVSFTGFCKSLGSMVALGIASLSMAFMLNWRMAFLVGACIAIIGTVARTKLREAPEFIEKLAKKRQTKIQKALSPAEKKLRNKSILAYFLITCAWPVCFYFSYIYCANILKDSFGYTPQQIIQQNLRVSIVEMLSLALVTFLSYKVYPLKILKIKQIVFFLFILACPYFLTNSLTPASLFWVQAISVFFSSYPMPAVAIILVHFPTLKRVTYVSFIYAFSRALMHIITSFGLIYLSTFMGHWGIWVIMLTTGVGFMWGVIYFEKLDKPNLQRNASPLEEDMPSLSQAA